MIQILENENFIKYADFSKEVWLLNRTNSEQLDERIINISEITESLLPTSMKLPKLMTEILEKHGNPFPEYEVITNNKSNYELRTYVCDENCIKTINNKE